jgi:hypothetical protein
MISRIHSGRGPRACRTGFADPHLQPERAIEMMKTGTLPGFAAAFGGQRWGMAAPGAACGLLCRAPLVAALSAGT